MDSMLLNSRDEKMRDTSLRTAPVCAIKLSRAIGFVCVVLMFAAGTSALAADKKTTDEAAAPSSLEKALEDSLRQGFDDETADAANVEQTAEGDDVDKAEAGDTKPTDGETAEGNAAAAKPKGLTKKRRARALDWLQDLTDGQRQAQLSGKPLFVLCGSASCVWCERLEKELASEDLKSEVERWTLVYLDVERHAVDAQRLQVAGVPALRLLTMRGTTIARRDGYMAASELKAWLGANYEQALSEPEEVLYSPAAPDEEQINQLLEYLTVREVATREAAIRRLASHRAVTSDAVVGSFVEGKLAARLGALEVLTVWAAPLDEMDPWRPETLTEERLARLDQWKAEIPKEPSESEEAGPLDGEQLSDAQAAIDKLLTMSEEEALVLYGRLSRYGAALLPNVYERLKESETDQATERLTALRYHLVASPRRILSWQQGLIALASADVATRRTAADQLVAKAVVDDEGLLLELFGHPDSLVRELSLKGLQGIGGARSTKSLVKLLQDPEPNVRAAVLKQLTEKPSTEMVPPVAEYLKTETDSDLIVHAVRFLREAKISAAIEALLTVAEHDSWQVRAEVAEGLASVASSSSEADQTEIFKALNKMLDDEDGFVVSRAIKGVQSGDVVPVDELIGIIERHPQLASDAIKMLAGSEKSYETVVPHLRHLTLHDEAAIRANALQGLYRMVPGDAKLEVLAGLEDQDTAVRQAAATIVFQFHEQAREAAHKRFVEGLDLTVDGSPAANVSKVAAGRVTTLVLEEKPKKSTMSKVFDFLVKAASKDPAAESGEATSDVTEANDAEAAAADAAVRAAVGAAIDTSGLPENGVATGEDAAAASEPVASEELPTEAAPKEVVATEAEPTDSVVSDDAASENATTSENIASKDAAAEQPLSPMAVWIDQYRANEHRAEWLSDAYPMLEEMLTAESLEERSAAAAAIIPFGRDDERAIKVLGEVVDEQESMLPRYASVLPWLPWSLRQEVFSNIAMMPIEGYLLGHVATQLNATPHPGAMLEIWKLFAREELSDAAAYRLVSTMQEISFGERYYDPDSLSIVVKKRVADDALPYLESEHEWQQTVALVLLHSANRPLAVEKATAIYEDDKNSSQLRDDALRVLLVSQTEVQRSKTALAALSSGDPLLGKTAVTLFARDIDAVDDLRDYITLRYTRSYTSFGNQSGPIVPKAPRRLKVEQVRPFLDSDEPETAAYAGYLMALLDDPSGIETMLAEWRKQKSPYGEWPRLVYRALAVTNDSQYIPVLEEIYESYVKADSTYRIREFYWTIRIMTGAEALKLRKRIRAERGMSNLR